MKTICTALATLSLFAGLALAPVARAATVVETYDFSFSGFVNGEGSDPSPLSSITGSVTLTFDPTVAQADDLSNITVNSYNGPSGTLGFTVLPQYNEVWIGDTSNGGSLYYDGAGGSNDFEFGLFVTDPSNPQIVPCSDAVCGSVPGTDPAAVYTLSGYAGDVWVATTESIAAVPEPAVWAMLVLGFGVVGGALRVRRHGFARA